MAIKFECEKVSAKQLTNGDRQLTVKVHPDDFHESIMKMAPGERLYIGAVPVNAEDEAISNSQIKTTNGRKPIEDQPRSTQAALAGQWDNFQQWLGVSSEDAAKNEIYSLTGVLSRKELNTNKAAGEAWDDIFARYRQDWARNG